MSESLVNFVLFKLSQVLQEFKLLTDVRQEADYITHELQLMKAFLRVDDSMDACDHDPSVKLWLQKVREVAFDIEDALDGFKLQVKRNSRPGNCRALIPRFLTGWRARKHVVLKIRNIKSKVTMISSMQQRYLIEKTIVDQASCSDYAQQLLMDKAAFLVDEADLAGIEKPKKKLIDWLLESESQRRVISVVGMGGVGKSTLVKKVYSDPEIRSQYKFSAWVYVSPSFKKENVLKDLVKQLFVVSGDNTRDIEIMRYDDLKRIIKEFLQHKKYLVVLDDVWGKHLWDDFDVVLPKNDCGSRVMITTHNSGIASRCSSVSPDRVYFMDPLTSEESVKLLCNEVFQRRPCPAYLWGIMNEILAKCGGLPLAIVVTAGILKAKNTIRTDDWVMVCRSLDNELGDNTRLLSLRKLLLLGYNDLPSYLKPCLLYFSIFPKGNLIDRRILVRLWMAEGFVEESKHMMPEEVAEEYLNELIERNLVQVAESTIDGQVNLCRIHELLHESIISKSREQDFAAILRDPAIIRIKDARRLSIQNGMSRLSTRCIAPRLRSLLMFLGQHSFLESVVSNLQSQLLNVLDLGGTPLVEFPKEVENFYLLKYLSLRNTNVKFIPNTIGKLQNLETLDVKHAKVMELPEEILNLQKLRHLLVYRYKPTSAIYIHDKYGCKVPAKIGGLQFVQKLCFLESTRGLIMDLARLKQLRRLGIIKFKKEDGEALCASVEKLRNLQALSITAINETEIIDLHYISSPPKNLQRIYLTGRLEKLPSWIASLTSLVKLVLRWSKLSNDTLSSLQKLPNLAHLEFIQAYDGEELHFLANSFQNLRLLGLKKLETLKKIILDHGALPSLEKLVLQGCKYMQALPSELKSVELYA